MQNLATMKINDIFKMFSHSNTVLADDFFIDRVNEKEELTEAEKERVFRILEVVENKYMYKDKCICGGRIETRGFGEHYSVECVKCEYLFMEE